MPRERTTPVSPAVSSWSAPTYAAAPDLYHQFGTHTVSTDEMTGIQALERIAETKPTKPGQEARMEFEYKRWGTQALICNFHVVTGEVVSPTVQETRTEVDFVKHIERTVATDAEADWVFVTDQLNIHQSEGLVKLVAKACGIAEETLGKKGKSGVLKSLKSRKEFLAETEPSHSLCLHSEALLVAEPGGNLVQHPRQRVLRRGNFTSKADLRAKILNFIDYFNEVLAKPFKWTFTGQILKT